MSGTATVFTGTALTLKDAINALHSASHKWYTIGVQLDVPTIQLKNIEKKSSDLMDQLLDTLDYWMNHDRFPSWRHLVDALRAPSVGENRLAGEIEEKYCDPEKPGSCDESGASVKPRRDEGTYVYFFHMYCDVMDLCSSLYRSCQPRHQKDNSRRNISYCFIRWCPRFRKCYHYCSKTK